MKFGDLNDKIYIYGATIKQQQRQQENKI
jgi:Ion transport protein